MADLLGKNLRRGIWVDCLLSLIIRIQTCANVERRSLEMLWKRAVVEATKQGERD